jgi:hypothetical protein
LWRHRGVAALEIVSRHDCYGSAPLAFTIGRTVRTKVNEQLQLSRHFASTESQQQFTIATKNIVLVLEGCGTNTDAGCSWAKRRRSSQDIDVMFLRCAASTLTSLGGAELS